MTIPTKSSTTEEIVRFILVLILTLLIIAGIGYGIYLLYKRYTIQKPKSKKVKQAKNDGRGNRFWIFNDEESVDTSRKENKEESKQASANRSRIEESKDNVRPANPQPRKKQGFFASIFNRKDEKSSGIIV